MAASATGLTRVFRAGSLASRGRRAAAAAATRASWKLRAALFSVSSKSDTTAANREHGTGVRAVLDESGARAAACPLGRAA